MIKAVLKTKSRLANTLLFLIIATAALPTAHAESNSGIYKEFTSLKGAYTFATTKDRENLLNIEGDLFNNAPQKWKDALLQSFWHDGFYTPRIGHVARFVTSSRTLGDTEGPYKVIMRVGNNLLMYPLSSFKESSKADYEAFMRERQELDNQFFGFTHGVSTIGDVKSSLKSKGMSIDRTFVSEDGLESTNIEITSGPLIPNFFGISADRMIFSFVENTLWSISFVINNETGKRIYKASDPYSDHFNFNNFFDTVFRDAINDKYNVYRSGVGGGKHKLSHSSPGFGFYSSYYWVSDSVLIFVHMQDAQEESSDPVMVVEYNHTPIYKRFKRIHDERLEVEKRQAEQAEKEKKAKEDKKFKSQI